MPTDSGPVLYQINTRIVLTEQRPGATLDDLPDALLDDVASRGVGIVWMLGIWQTGPAGRAVSRTQPQWRRGFEQQLPDLSDADICGSPFAITAYTPNADFGGPSALARLRGRLATRGLRLLLDFVPNHVALDHPWTDTHPEFFIPGSAADLAAQPANFVTLPSGKVLAHGRDPYFPGWPDTLQLNYRHAGLRKAMIEVLVGIAEVCDGVRCDMAMLLLPEIFRSTWGERSRPADGSGPVDEPFWPEAVKQVRARNSNFLFLAEVYWEREWDLQQQGFDYTYDKRLYDRLRAGRARPVRDHLSGGGEFQRKCARFLENHDEPRAASVFPHYQHRAAAVVAYLSAGLRFFHEGQWEGRKVHPSIHLARRPVEPVDPELRAFYMALLACLKRPELAGTWQWLPCRPAWEANSTFEQYLNWVWHGPDGKRLLVTVNYGPERGQCYIPLPWGVAGNKVQLRDLLGPARYEREGAALAGRGLYLDVPAWGYHCFEVTAT